MFVTELDSFVHKFHQLWNAGYNAHLDLDTHAGYAWVGIRVQLGQVPGPLHHQVPPFSNIQKKTESSSRQRRHARRAAERKAAALEPSEAAKASSPKENIDEQQRSNDIKTIDKTEEETSKETIVHENDGIFNDIIDNDSKTEEVSIKIPTEVDKDAQTDDESCQCAIFKGKTINCENCRKLYCEFCPAGPIRESENLICLECMESMFSCTSFLTSTPKKKSL